MNKSSGFSSIILIALGLVTFTLLGTTCYTLNTRNNNEIPNTEAVQIDVGNVVPIEESTMEDTADDNTNQADESNEAPVDNNAVVNETQEAQTPPTTTNSNNKSPSIKQSGILNGKEGVATTSDYGEFKVEDYTGVREGKNYSEENTYLFYAEVDDSDGWISKVQFILDGKVVREAYPNGANYSKKDRWNDDDLDKGLKWAKSYMNNKVNTDKQLAGRIYYRNESFSSGYESCKYREGLRLIYAAGEKLYDLMARDPENIAECASGNSLNFHNIYLGIKVGISKGAHTFEVKAIDNSGSETTSSKLRFTT